MGMLVKTPVGGPAQAVLVTQPLKLKRGVGDWGKGGS